MHQRQRRNRIVDFKSTAMIQAHLCSSCCCHHHDNRQH